MTGTSDLDRFTNGGITSRQDRLPGPLRDLHRAVLRGSWRPAERRPPAGSGRPPPTVPRCRPPG